MDNKSKIIEAFEEALEPKFLNGKQVVFFEDQKVDWSKERTDVEVYIQFGKGNKWNVYVLGVKYAPGASNAIRKAVKKRFETAKVITTGAAGEECILCEITIME